MNYYSYSFISKTKTVHRKKNIQLGELEGNTKASLIAVTKSQCFPLTQFHIKILKHDKLYT